jgi:hypothetical protein
MPMSGGPNGRAGGRATASAADSFNVQATGSWTITVVSVP